MSNNNGSSPDEVMVDDPLDLPDAVENKAEFEAAFPGVKIDGEGQLKRRDGILTGNNSDQYRSLMKSLISHIKTGDEFLDLVQELKVANYLTSKEADLVTAAIAERREFKANIESILIWVINRGSVNNNAVQNVLKGLTHTTTSFNSNRSFNWGKKKNGSSGQITQ